MILKELYYKRMEDENSMDIDNIKNTPPKLSYEAFQERDICLRAVAENCEDTLPA